MLLGLLSLISLAGGVPDDLRRDGTGYVTCSSVDAISIAASAMPSAAQDIVQVGDTISQIADPDAPFWFVVGDVNGRALPLQMVFIVEDGASAPGFLRMMPGRPRISQEGNRVVVLLGPPPESKPDGEEALARFDRIRVGEGCTAVTTMPPGVRVGLAVGLDGTVNYAAPVETIDELRGPVAALAPVLGAVAQALTTPERPRREAWASTASAPDLVLRVNAMPDAVALSEAFVGERLEDLDRVRLESGTELAVWQGGTGVDSWAISVPVRRPRTVRWWPGRLAARARKDGLETSRKGKARGITTEQGTLWVAAKKRRLLLASSAELANELRDPDVGTAWAERHGDASTQPGVAVSAGTSSARIDGRIVREGDELVFEGHSAAVTERAAQREARRAEATRYGLGNTEACRRYAEHFNGLSCVPDVANIDPRVVCQGQDTLPADTRPMWQCMTENASCRNGVFDAGDQSECARRVER